LNLTCYGLQAQELVQKKYIEFDTKIHDLTGQKFKGYIATIDDTAVYLTQNEFALTFEKTDLTHMQKFGYRDISKLSIYANKVGKKGALIGGISGLVVGALIGYACTPKNPPTPHGIGYITYSGFTPGVGAVVGGSVGLVVGSILGRICAHPRSVFRIHGQKSNLDDMREAMIKRLYL
jgi:hypothetical protein